MQTRAADLWRYLKRPDRWKLHLGLAGCLVLVVGAALAPPPRTTTPSVPQADATPLLREELERRDVPDAFQRVALVGPRIDATVVAIDEPRAAEPRARADHALAVPAARPRGHGIVISGDGLVLSHLDAIAGAARISTRLADRSTDATVVAVDPETGLILLSLDSAEGTASARVASAMPAPGSLAAAATRWMPHVTATAQPTYIAGAVGSAVALAPVGGDLLPGTPVFDLDGVALAIVTRRHEAVAIASALARLGEIRASNRALPRTLGLGLQAVSDAMRPHLDAAIGAMVVGVGNPAREAGLELGDGLKAIDGRPVVDVDAAIDLIARAEVGQPVELLVDRRGSEQTVVVAPVIALPAANSPATVVPAESFRATTILSADALAAARVPDRAVILEIDRRRLGERAARALLARRTTPHLILFWHDGEAWFDVIGDRP